MRTNLIILFCILLSTLAATLFYSTKSLPIVESKVIQTEKPFNIIPKFAVKNLDGTRYEVTELRERVLLINFWASWCIPCKQEFPVLLRLADTFKTSLTLVLISNDEDLTSITNFTKGLSEKDQNILEGKNVILHHDANKSISHDIFQSIKLPETILVDQEGYMIKKYIGADWKFEDIEVEVNKLLHKS